MNSENLMEQAVKFHGHSCPGLAFGVVAAKFILNNWSKFSMDEEIVAVVENDNCSVDAIQSLLGTTFGKGNMIFRDYGKNAYTFYNRGTKEAIRLSLKNDFMKNRSLDRDTLTQKILDSNPEEIFDIKRLEIEEPLKAKLHESTICESCGELTMITRIKQHGNKNLCIPCFQKLIQNTN